MDAKHRELIENIIRQNPNFVGHEYLMESICSEVYKKSYLLLDAVSNIESLRNYLNKVADTSILNIIRSQGVDSVSDKTKAKQTENTKKIAHESLSGMDFVRSEAKVNCAKAPEISEVGNVNENDVEINNPYEGLIDPLEFFPEKMSSPALAKSIVEALYQLDSKYPAKKYLDIFKMRYIYKYEQSLIAKKIKLSKSDLSKRFCEMVKYIRQQIL